MVVLEYGKDHAQGPVEQVNTHERFVRHAHSNLEHNRNQYKVKGKCKLIPVESGLILNGSIDETDDWGHKHSDKYIVPCLSFAHVSKYLGLKVLILCFPILYTQCLHLF